LAQANNRSGSGIAERIAENSIKQVSHNQFLDAGSENLVAYKTLIFITDTPLTKRAPQTDCIVLTLEAPARYLNLST